MLKRRIAAICVALFALNAAMCAPLFGISYLDQFQSNEGSFITFGKFLLDHWPHVGWFPWFNAGMPFENTYLPLTAFSVAMTSFATGLSPAHAFHIIAALAYALAPVFLFLFAWQLSGQVWTSAWAAVLWSLLSPAATIPAILRDMGTPWGLRRLQNIVVYGETPHNLALCLLPLALLLLNRYLDRPTPRRFGLAAIAAAAVMLTNAFGAVVVSISAVILFAARGKHTARGIASVFAMLACAYLAICRMLTPTLLRLIETNSQMVGGDYRFTWKTVALAGSFFLILGAAWAAMRRLWNPAARFAALFSVCFGGIAVLGFHGVNLVPQPGRYHIEMEAGLCLLAAFLLEPVCRKLPARARMASAIALAAALVWVGAKDYRFARRLIRPVDIADSVPYREARWIAENLPGERVLVAGEGEWLFNLFAENPQLGAGHEPSAPNWMQRVAVYTIFTGENAGAQDAAISILWLKAYGCGAIVVPGAGSKDHYHAIADPKKFDGLLPLIWREGGDSIYRVPLRSVSLAHVIPRSAIVTRRPIHGLDVDPVRPYVAALDDPAEPEAALHWQNPDHGRIVATVPRGDVISVQMTYDPGWRARAAGRDVPVTADQLGFLTIDPQCTGACSVDLEFTGGAERNAALAVSLLAGAGLLAAVFTGRKPRPL